VEGTTVVGVDGTKVIHIIIKGVGSGGGGGGIGGKRLVVLLLLSLLVWGGGHCNVHVEFVESVNVPWVGRQRCS
jgi:hypothetical protein